MLLRRLVMWAVLATPVVAAALAEGQVVDRYGLFETSIANTRTYGNPFKETTLAATFTSPSARQFVVDGFHDGEQTWRLRFMPDEVGTWSYVATFSDGAPGASGAFTCAAGALHGPLRVNASNRVWFEHADGSPFYMRAFHLWFVCRLDSRGVLLDTLDYLKGQGFNAIVGPHVTESDTLLPWPRTSGVLDFSRFNLTEWQRLDKVLTECAARGMVLIPFSIMGGTNGVPKIDTSANRDLFLRYWVARWGGFWNATYQPTSEWEEGYSESEVLQILNRIVELDGGRHLVSLHSQNDSTTSVQRASAYHYHTVQDKLSEYNPSKYTWFVNLYNSAPKPILAQESLWEGNLYQTEAGLDMDNMRRGAWVIALSGGQINYADEVIPPRNYGTHAQWGPQFSQYGTEMKAYGWLYPYLRIVGGFIESLPLSSITLQPALASTGMCLAQPGSRYLSYTTGSTSMTLNLGAVSGTLDARWLNPRTGEMGEPFQVQGGAVRSFTPPDTSDWALYVQHSSIPLPAAPGPLMAFAVQPDIRRNTLTWTAPSETVFARTVIRYSTTGYPTSPTDGSPLVNEIGTPGAPGSFVHTGLSSGVTCYYSAFTSNWFGASGDGVFASGVPFSPGDFDRDYDVDQSDFGGFQACIAGVGVGYPDGCEEADLQEDGDVDQTDLALFLPCMQGANQTPGC